jgi:hypothetical protein
MYFSYLRGRQYELLALKELAKGNLISASVIPVIEPVKITATLEGTLSAFNDAKLPIALIFNPSVGELASSIERLFSCLSKNSAIIPSVVCSQTAEHTISELDKNNITANSILAVLNNRDYLAMYQKLFTSIQPKYTLLSDERSMRRTVKSNKVLFEDKFQKQARNADYPEDEFFSEDHLYYEEEGYIGFGDYSIIGDEYSESGFAPLAVAIHIVYFDEELVLRVHHFVSDSNFGREDVAGKFYEALTKLSEWHQNKYQQLKNQQTAALSTLLKYYETGYYPGLPTLKKLSIMHHLELMNKYLVGGLQE